MNSDKGRLKRVPTRFNGAVNIRSEQAMNRSTKDTSKEAGLLLRKQIAKGSCVCMSLVIIVRITTTVYIYKKATEGRISL